MLGIHGALFGSNVTVDFIHANEISAAGLKQFKLVLFPYPVMMPSRAASELKRYVAEGGHLVMEARAAWQNEQGRASDTIPGLGLHEVLGCRETDVQTGVRGRTAIRWDSDLLPGVPAGAILPARWFEETLEPTGDARVVARFEDGRVAAVLGSYGRGKTLTLGSFVGAAYQTTPDSAVERFYNALLDWAGVARNIRVTGGDLEVRVLESGASRIAFVFNHAAARSKAAVSITPAATSAVDLTTGAPTKLTAGSFNVDLEPAGVAVVRLSN
jgi:beta-galactosidase